MGRIGAPHGVRGAVKVRPQSADPGTLLEHREWWMRRQGSAEWTPLTIRECRAQGATLVALFEGVASRDAAAALRGSDVGVPREALAALGRGEHFRADLIGFEVVNREGKRLGRVAEFADTGAHPLLRVAAERGAELLIPWVALYIDGVDVAAGRIDVDWPFDA